MGYSPRRAVFSPCTARTLVELELISIFELLVDAERRIRRQRHYSDENATAADEFVGMNFLSCRSLRKSTL